MCANHFIYYWYLVSGELFCLLLVVLSDCCRIVSLLVLNCLPGTTFPFSFLFSLVLYIISFFVFSLSQRIWIVGVCMLRISYQVRWHGIALSTLLLLHYNGLSLCRGFVATELASLDDGVCMLRISYRVRWHGIALSTILLLHFNGLSLCRGFVTPELASLDDEESRRTLGVVDVDG